MKKYRAWPTAMPVYIFEKAYCQSNAQIRRTASMKMRAQRIVIRLVRSTPAIADACAR